MNSLTKIEEFENIEAVFIQVEQAKQQWESAVDALPELICVVDNTGEIIRANRAIESWTKVPVTEIVGQNLHNLIHPECEAPCCINTFWLKAKRDTALLSMITAQEYDPILDKHLLIRARRTIQGKWGDQNNMIVILHDVSRQHEMETALRENARRFEVLNAISKSILIAQDPKQIANLVLKNLPNLVPHSFACIVSYDSNLEDMTLLGLSSEEMLPAQVNLLKDFALRFSGNNSHLRQDFIIDDTIQTPNQDSMLAEIGKSEIHSIWNVPLKVGKRFFGTIFLADKQPSAFSAEQTSVMNEVANLLTVALKQAWLRSRLEKSNENLQQMLRANQEQLQTVSHDLRSPLGIIKGYTEMMHTGLLGPLTEEQESAMKILDKKGDQLLNMVESLFTLKKVDSNNLQREDVDPTEFLAEIVESWRVLTNNKEIKLRTKIGQELPTQYVDKNLLNRVIYNLLDNAIKFSQPGDTITVGARVTYSDLVITVADEGRGIPPAKLENIFQRFYQVEKESDQAKMGAGIGLALCHAIITAHGGRIWAESEGENKGTTFFISLPVKLSTEDLAL